MNATPVQVILYTIPSAACNSGKMNWHDVALLMKNQLQTAFGEKASFTHKEFMSPEWFTDDKAQHLLSSGEVNFPFVLVDEEVACSETKVNVSKVRRCVKSKLNS
jgi:hypothetical protein